MQIIDGGDYRLYIAELAPGSRSDRREREQAAVAQLIAAAFGASACKGNDEGGAPFVMVNGERVAIPISVSHSRRIAVLAVSLSGGAIGVDVEEERPHLERVVRRVCSDAEWAVYGTDTQHLLQAWTLKEALYKACRTAAGAEIDFAVQLHLPLFADGTARATASDGRLVGEYAVAFHTLEDVDAVVGVVIKL